MESRAKFLGHPIHQMLIVFPLGLLAMSVIFDILYLITGNTLFTIASYYDIIAGIISGLIAAVFGLTDWLAIPSGTRAKRIGAIHGLGNATIVLLFLISWFLRRDNPDFVPPTFAFLLSLVGAGLATITGWLGGELVDRLGVGVYPNAHLDASSSLTGQPVTGAPSSNVMEHVAVPVTGADKYREKHIEKGLTPDSNAPLNTGRLGDEPPDNPMTGSGVERDNLD